MKKSVLFAFALLLAGSASALPSYAAEGNESGAAATEPMKAKPAKRHTHKHERHSFNAKAHRHHRTA